MLQKVQTPLEKITDARGCYRDEEYNDWFLYPVYMYDDVFNIAYTDGMVSENLPDNDSIHDYIETHIRAVDLPRVWKEVCSANNCWLTTNLADETVAAFLADKD